jgi:cobalamin biosynthesis protein CobD/CbiB
MKVKMTTTRRKANKLEYFYGILGLLCTLIMFVLMCLSADDISILHAFCIAMFCYVLAGIEELIRYGKDILDKLDES